MGRPQKYKVGHKHYGWTVIDITNNKKRYLCQCECGEIRNLRSFTECTQSCGCRRGALLKVSYAEKQSRGIYHPSRKHGLSQTREYRSYSHMISRCCNPNNDGYHLYGGRGITVCSQWLNSGGFNTFLQDMGPRPDATSIDRINPDGNYEPTNCRWADDKTQIENRRYIVQISLDRLQKLEALAAQMGVKV